MAYKARSVSVQAYVGARVDASQHKRCADAEP